MIFGGVPIFGDSGEVIGALITIRNVSAESELQKKYDERKKESVIDGLTRLFNKTYTESTLLRVIKTSLRELQGISVVMCDIDHFKRVNDTFGHQAGDYVLSTVAQMLKGETRDSDICGRFGGEEFLVILCNSDVTGAKVFAERFRKRVASTQIFFEGKHVPVTVSLGTSTFLERWFPGLNAEKAVKELVAHADTALYFAKANGRNQSCQFESLPTQTGAPAKKNGGQQAA
jgi:diguanylate cyclase (GGDEF)-like protein